MYRHRNSKSNRTRKNPKDRRQRRGKSKRAGGSRLGRRLSKAMFYMRHGPSAYREGSLRTDAEMKEAGREMEKYVEGCRQSFKDKLRGKPVDRKKYSKCKRQMLDSEYHNMTGKQRYDFLKRRFNPSFRKSEKARIAALLESQP